MATLSAKITLAISILLASFVLFSQASFASTISGIVYDNHRIPLMEVDVELQDDLYRQIGRTRTNPSGRYEFDGLKDSNYTVRVMPFRYDLQDESVLVELSTIASIPGQTPNTYMTQDFYLAPRKGSLADTEAGVIFAQEIPKEAQTLYNTAIKDLSKQKVDAGILELKKAVEIAPNYFNALHNLGKQLFFKGEYGEALQNLLKAAEVNDKSPTNFYYLGYTLNKLKYNKAALIPLNKALIMSPSSVQVLHLIGITEIAEGKYADAEKHLLKAKKLSTTPIPDVHWQLAQIYGNQLKKYKEAADELELFLKAGDYESAYITKIKKIIADFRVKAKQNS